MYSAATMGKPGSGVIRSDGSQSGSLDGHGGKHSLWAHRTQQGEGAPLSGGRALPHPLAARSSTVTSRHLGGGSAFVLEYQSLRIDLAYRRPPPLPTGLNCGCLLFVRVERLFLSRSPSLCSTRQRC